MDSFSNIMIDLQSPAWWFGVVIVGITINILSSWVQRALSTRFELLSKFAQRHFIRFESKRRERVQTVRDDHSQFVKTAIREMRARHRATLHLFSGGFGLIGISLLKSKIVAFGLFTPLAFLTTVLIFIGLHSFFAAEYEMSILQSAEDDFSAES